MYKVISTYQSPATVYKTLTGALQGVKKLQKIIDKNDKNIDVDIVIVKLTIEKDHFGFKIPKVETVRRFRRI